MGRHMNIWNGIDAFPADAPGVVATIGNYDGVHLGHQAILRQVVEDARAHELRSLLITFEPHPLTIIAPERKPRLLQTRGQKLEALERTELDDLLILSFDLELAALGGEEFFDQLLADRIPFRSVRVGENFRFGHDRQGDVELLRRIGIRRGFEIHGLPTVEIDGTVVSSTAIRAALDAGDVALARRMLGRPFLIAGEVVRGDGRGRTLNCPTANIRTDNEVLPGPGVYVTETLVLANRFPSVANVGYRPTFDGKALTVETHLLGVDEDLYDEPVELCFLERLRDEVRFDDVSELADQLARDRAAAEAFFQNQSLSAP